MEESKGNDQQEAPVPRTEEERVALYQELLAQGLSDSEARGTAWPESTTSADAGQGGIVLGAVASHDNSIDGNSLEQQEEDEPDKPYVAWVPIGEANLVRVHQLLESVAHRERELVTQIQQLLAPV